MKLEIILFCFTLILAFITGNITYFIKSEKKGNLSDLEQIRKLHVEIQEELRPYKRLDLNLDYPTPEHVKLIQKTTKIPGNKSSIFLNSAECLKSKISQISSSYINKETLWLAFLCNQVDKLPRGFFSSPPFIHQNGLSYSFMRYKMTRSQSEKVKWLESHGKYMHIEELKALHWPTSINLRFLINQPDDVLQKIIQKDYAFLTDSFYFIKTGNLKYYVIDQHKAKRFFLRAGYDFELGGNQCLFKIGLICWKKKAKNLQSLLSQSTTGLFIVTVILLLLSANGLYSRLKRKKLEEERKKHALRILTHELRTPISSLILQMNDLNKDIDKLPHENQEQVLKIEGQIYRLKHLAQKSLSYLQTDDTKLIHLNNTQIDSLIEFIQEILCEHNEANISFKYTDDCSLMTDAYWLKMSISNLIENAIRYGEGQIQIVLSQSKNSIFIQVIDEGRIPYKNLKDLLKSKHHNSKGLGLGLSIVSRTLKEMGAKLSLTNTPTTFTIEFNKTKEHNNDGQDSIS